MRDDEPRLDTEFLEQFRSIFRLHPAILLLIDPDDGRIVDANPAAVNFYGYPAHELTGMHIQDINASSHEEIEEKMRRAAQNKETSFHFPHRLASGEIRHVNVRSGPVLVGDRTFLLSVVEDVTPRLRAEHGRQELARILEATTDFVCIVDGDRAITFVNDAGLELLGFDAGVPEGLSVDQLFPDQVIAIVDEEILPELESGGSWQGELTILDSGGLEIAVSAVLTSRIGPTGEPGGFSAIMRDIRPMKAREEALRESRQMYRLIVEQSLAGVYIIEKNAFTYVNPRFAEIFGYEPEELCDGRSPITIASEVDRPRVQEMVRKRLNGEIQEASYEFEGVRSDGAVVRVVVFGRAIELHGEIVIFGLLLDVTQERVLQKQLQEAQKMEVVGRLAGGVAHDFNNILSAISGYIELLLVETPTEDGRRADLEEVKEATQRGSDLTSKLLAFSRRQELKPEPINLAEILAGVEKMLVRLLTKDIALVVDTGNDVDVVLADPSQVEQVLLNLAVNARDAMPQGGSVLLKVRNVHISKFDLKAQVPAGDYVLLSVTDSGTGIPPELLDQIFEPFFTTKGEGEGTGLGLSIVYGIVRQSRGHIRVRSAVGQGTTFDIYLPARKALSPESAESGSAPEDPVQRLDPGPAGLEDRTLLVVDDDEAVLEPIRRLLERQGATVLTARSPTEALESVLPSHSGKLDLVITDFVLPKMSGLELAEEIEEVQPDTRFLFISGYADAELREKGLEPGDKRFLSKPFDFDTLLNRIRENLANPG